MMLIIGVLLALASSSGLTYYIAVLHPAQLQAQTNITAQATQTQVNAIARAALLNAYIQATKGKPALQSPLSTNDAFDWHEYDTIHGGSCTFKGGAYHASASLGHNNQPC